MEKNHKVTKSIKLTRKDEIALADIVQKDPRIEHGASEALRICLEDAAAAAPNWVEVTRKAEKLDYPENLTLDGSETRSFVVSPEVFGKVYNSVCQQLDTSRPRSSFVIRLCIYHTRLKLYQPQENQPQEKVLEEPDMLLSKADLIDQFKTLGTDQRLLVMYELLLDMIGKE